MSGEKLEEQAPSAVPPCPQCKSAYAYEDGYLLICPECAHEWSANSAIPQIDDKATDVDDVVKDAHGNILIAGDTVMVIKDLKVRGSSSTVKVGTKVKIARLLDGDHNIDCRISGVGALELKSEFVKKVST